MTKLKWDRYVGTARADRSISGCVSPLKRQLRILMERKDLLEQTKQRGISEKNKASPNQMLLAKLRGNYKYYRRLVDRAP